MNVGSSTVMPIICSLYLKPRAYSVACFIATNSLPKVLVSQEVCCKKFASSSSNKLVHYSGRQQSRFWIDAWLSHQHGCYPQISSLSSMDQEGVACCMAVPPLILHNHRLRMTSLVLQTKTCQLSGASDRTPSKYSNVHLSRQRCDRSLSRDLHGGGQDVKTS